MYWTGNSLDNLLSYFGLFDARISTSEKDLPVLTCLFLVCVPKFWKGSVKCVLKFAKLLFCASFPQFFQAICLLKAECLTSHGLGTNLNTWNPTFHGCQKVLRWLQAICTSPQKAIVVWITDCFVQVDFLHQMNVKTVIRTQTGFFKHSNCLYTYRVSRM